jgi:hypothetical protein
LTEWNWDDVKAVWREEGLEEGLKRGIEKQSAGYSVEEIRKRLMAERGVGL